MSALDQWKNNLKALKRHGLALTGGDARELLRLSIAALAEVENLEHQNEVLYRHLHEREKAK